MYRWYVWSGFWLSTHPFPPDKVAEKIKEARVTPKGLDFVIVVCTSVEQFGVDVCESVTRGVSPVSFEGF